MNDDIELYILLQNGQPIQHPILGDNFKQAFPNISLTDLPNERVARFQRVSKPIPDRFEIVEGPTYGWENGIVKDIWTTRSMTEEERQTYRDEQYSIGPPDITWKSWTWNEELCEWEPPVAHPDDPDESNVYYWHEESLSWKLFDNN